MKAQDIILVAANYRVVALRKASGEQLWETVLVPGFFKFGNNFVSAALDETGVYAYASNQMFRLDLQTGAILWQKKLPSLTGLVTSSIAFLGMASSASTPIFANETAKRAEADSGGST